MSVWVLVTSAGSGASGNLVRSLRAGCAGLTIVGCHDDQFILKNSTADRNYLVPPLAHPIARSEISTTPGSQTVFAVDLKEDSRHTTIRVAATPKSARTRALLAQFKKGVRAIEKKWKAHAAVVGSIELDGPIGSHTLEAVRLEIRRLARACGLDVVDVRVETRGKASG